MYTKLDEMLAKMPVGSARNVYFAHEGTHVVNGVATLGGQGYLFGVLSKQLSTDSGDYAHFELYSYLGRRYQIDKVLTWGVVEFDNPAMGIGVEYRTTERSNGNPVYTKLISLGEMPAANTALTVSHGVTCTDFIDYDVYCSYYGNIRKFVMGDVSGQPNCIVTNTAVYLKTGTTALTGYTGYAKLWYVK